MGVARGRVNAGRKLLGAIQMPTIRGLCAAGLGGLLLLGSGAAWAAPFSEIRIGDRDGLGFGTGASTCPGGACTAANGGPANVGAGGDLGAEALPTVGDFLPDLNANGAAGPDQGDDFDNRAGEGVGGAGFTDAGTGGTSFTDIALSTSYDASSAADEVWDAGSGTFGSGGAFPKGASDVLSNQPGFEFRFDVSKDNIDPDASVFFNVVFADFGVTPFDLELTSGDGTTRVLGITPQNNAEGEDGLIQASFAELDFGEVFADDGAAWDGHLDVTFDAPNEPYTAYDYVELSTEPITTNVPLPGTLFLLGLGALALGATLRARPAAAAASF